MKGDHEVIAAVVIFFIGVVFGSLLEGKLIGILFKDYVPALATLLAAFIGASYAFRLQSKKEERGERRKNIIAGNIAVFNILRMLNTLLSYKTQVIDPVRGKKTAFIEMQPTLHLLEPDVELDLASLAFLLESDDPNILGEISVEYSRFQKALDAINQRSHLHMQQVQPILEKRGFVEGADYTFKQIEHALGNRLYITLGQATEQVINHVDSTIISLQETGAKVTGVLKTLYPEEKVMGVAVADFSEHDDA